MLTRPSTCHPLRAWLCFCAALVFNASAIAAGPKGVWISTHKACEFSAWTPNANAGESITWTGECQDDVAHGSGTLQWFRDYRAAEKQTGQAVNGKWHGRVLSQFNFGARDEGDYAQGRRIGLARQSFSRAATEELKTRSPYKDWLADGYWEKDEFVLPMLHSRFQEPRPCPRAEQRRDQCASLVKALLATENTALTTINQLGRCLNHAEMLMEVYGESQPDKQQMTYYGQAFEKITALAKGKGYAEHMDTAQADSQPAVEADMKRIIGPRLEALRQKQLDEDAEQRAFAPLAIEALAPYFQKNCAAYLK